MKLTRRIACIILTVLMLLEFGQSALANSLIPRYAVTDSSVVIDYVVYPIYDNTITYNGKLYYVNDAVLVHYDANNDPVYLILPVEENRVTDETMLSKLNAAIGVSCADAIPSTTVSLPYTSSVQTGENVYMTPAFDVITGSQFYQYTKLKLTDFPLLADKRFKIIYTVWDEYGGWNYSELDQDFFWIHTARFQNLSSNRYGMFIITNLYGSPSPSYTYNIFLSNNLLGDN